ncbi:hypothetical protein LWI29_019518 [Acer saccharum]|uniref:Uncharacterized protein n=1 Tax=Acer saccharum TaxID=4024 RepID=A0AA39RDX7_ACESA|nr:hypothetical protein LWI29_019518 [Acer saccharum]
MVLSLRRPAMNRGLNRENPRILIMMMDICWREADIERQRNGPSKACNRYEWHCTKREEFICILNCLLGFSSSPNQHKVNVSWRQIVKDYRQVQSAVTDIASQNSVVIDGIPNSLVGFNSIDLNNQNHQNRALAGFPMHSALQGEHISGIHTDLHITSDSRNYDSNALVTLLGRNAVRDASLGSSSPIDNMNFQEHLEGGTLISSTSLANLLATRSGLQENLNNLAISVPSIYPMDVLEITLLMTALMI